MLPTMSKICHNYFLEKLIFLLLHQKVINDIISWINSVIVND